MSTLFSGECPRSLYHSLPTPRSSSDSTRSSSLHVPQPPTRSHSQSDVRVQSTGGIASLLTPQPSLDSVKPKSTHEKSKANESALHKYLEACKKDGIHDDEPKVFYNITREIWDAIYVDYGEDSKFLLNYDAERSIVIVHWVTGIHESFKIVVAPLAHIADSNPDQFKCHTNKALHIPGSRGSRRIPDFALSKRTMDELEDPDYLVFLECSFGQREKSLKDTANMWLNAFESVMAVIMIDIDESPQFANPKKRSKVPPANVTFKDFSEQVKAPEHYFGPVTYENHTWAGAISSVIFTVIWRGGKTEAWDITPSFNGTDIESVSDLHDVSAVMLHLARKTFGNSLIKAACPSGFSIHWKEFYRDLRFEMAHRAFDRFCVFHENRRDLVYGKKRARAEGQDGDSSSDSEVMLNPPDVKKRKID